MLLVFLGLLVASDVSAAQKLSLVIVVMDAVRSDHTTPYGYPRDTTPNLMRAARGGVLYRKAFTNASFTLPSFASIMTGRRPQSHGLLRIADALDGESETLAAVLAREGYRTAAFTNSLVSGARWNLLRGFETVGPRQGGGSSSKDDAKLPLKIAAEAALGWISAAPRQPFFALVHGMDVHTPYSCPLDFRGRYGAPYADPRRDEWVDLAFRFNLDAGSLAMAWPDVDPGQLARAASLQKDAAFIDYVRAQYDGCLRYEDQALGELLSGIKRLGIDNETAVIITSDHGESLGEHGGFAHFDQPFYEEIMAVPLVIQAPGWGRGVEVADRAAELIDVFPTACDLLGVACPAGLDGRSLKPASRGKVPASESSVLAGSRGAAKGDRIIDAMALRRGNWKLLGWKGRWELYDLAHDPEETVDLGREMPGVVRDLSGEILRLSGASSGMASTRGARLAERCQAAAVLRGEHAQVGMSGDCEAATRVARAYLICGDAAEAVAVLNGAAADSGRGCSVLDLRRKLGLIEDIRSLRKGSESMGVEGKYRFEHTGVGWKASSMDWVLEHDGNIFTAHGVSRDSGQPPSSVLADMATALVEHVESQRFLGGAPTEDD